MMTRPAMTRPLIVLCLSLALAGCASRWNPWNWFGNSEPVAATELPAAPQDPRDLVAAVLSMTVEPVQSGAIVRATGRTPTQGWFKADLVPQPVTPDGILVLEFRIKAPLERTDVNTPRSREVTAALHLSNVKLREVRQIMVQGAQDARAVSR